MSEKTFEIGQTTEGTVSQINPFGAFVDLGRPGVVGLVHVSEIPNVRDEWTGRDRLIEDIIIIGEVKSFRVLNIDAERGRVMLSLKNIDPPVEH